MDATQTECAEKSAMASCVSLAYSGARFGNAVLAGLGGKKTAERAYVKQTVNELPFFSSEVTFGKTDIEKVHDVGTMSE